MARGPVEWLDHIQLLLLLLLVVFFIPSGVKILGVKKSELKVKRKAEVVILHC